MQIACPACNKHLHIADNKLPSGRQIRLTCPACQERFTCDPQSIKPLAGNSAKVTVPTSPSAPTTAPTRSTSLKNTAALTTWFSQTEIKEAGPAPRALVCLDTAAYGKACEDALPSLGFRTIHSASNQAQALAYLAEFPYEFVILDAMFDGSNLDANPILACVAELPMEQRRYMFVTLCIADAATADPLVSYGYGVNFVVVPSDIPTPSYRFTLRQNLNEHKRLYRTYRTLRKQLGKDA